MAGHTCTKYPSHDSSSVAAAICGGGKEVTEFPAALIVRGGKPAFTRPRLSARSHSASETSLQEQRAGWLSRGAGSIEAAASDEPELGGASNSPPLLIWLTLPLLTSCALGCVPGIGQRHAEAHRGECPALPEEPHFCLAVRRRRTCTVARGEGSSFGGEASWHPLPPIFYVGYVRRFFYHNVRHEHI